MKVPINSATSAARNAGLVKDSAITFSSFLIDFTVDSVVLVSFSLALTAVFFAVLALEAAFFVAIFLLKIYTIILSQKNVFSKLLW